MPTRAAHRLGALSGLVVVAGAAVVAGLTSSTDVSTSMAEAAAGNQPPQCRGAAARPAMLWPPDGRLAPVAIAGATDPDGDPVAFTITGIRQDEPLAGPADGDGVDTPTARLRAWREGGGDGRVYHLRFEAHDGRGGACAGTVTVCVPHDRRRGIACRDGGALFDSTGPAR